MVGRGRVIVSCTSTAGRLDLLFYMLQSIQRQTLRPDRIFLNLSSEPYLRDSGVHELPMWLSDSDIAINWVANTGSYRKLLPVINLCEDDDLVVTADDDILYHKKWLSSLVQLNRDHPDHLVCARARRMKRSVLGGWQNYARWRIAAQVERGMDLLPTGGGGAVYRRGLLDLRFLNDQSFMAIAPTNDDLWFRMASFKKNVPVYVDPSINLHNCFISHPWGLEKINSSRPGKRLLEKMFYYSFGKLFDWLGLAASKNDKAWTAIVKHVRADAVEKDSGRHGRTF